MGRTGQTFVQHSGKAARTCMDRETRRDQHAARDRQHHLDTAPTVLILRGCTVLALSPEFGAHSGALDGLQYTSVIHATRRARDRHAAIDEIERQVLRPNDRSEEHTSELQSLMRISYAVFCLKKKTHTQY